MTTPERRPEPRCKIDGIHTDFDREGRYVAEQLMRYILAALDLDEENQQKIERELVGCDQCIYAWLRDLVGFAAGLLEANRGGNEQARAFAQEQLDLILNTPDILTPPDED